MQRSPPLSPLSSFDPSKILEIHHVERPGGYHLCHRDVSLPSPERYLDDVSPVRQPRLRRDADLSDELALAACGYKQEFRRDFSFFTSFSVAFTVLGTLPSVGSILYNGMGEPALSSSHRRTTAYYYSGIRKVSSEPLGECHALASIRFSLSQASASRELRDRKHWD